MVSVVVPNRSPLMEIKMRQSTSNNEKMMIGGLAVGLGWLLQVFADPVADAAWRVLASILGA